MNSRLQVERSISIEPEALSPAYPPSTLCSRSPDYHHHHQPSTGKHIISSLPTPNEPKCPLSCILWDQQPPAQHSLQYLEDQQVISSVFCDIACGFAGAHRGMEGAAHNVWGSVVLRVLPFMWNSFEK